MSLDAHCDDAQAPLLYDGVEHCTFDLEGLQELVESSDVQGNASNQRVQYQDEILDARDASNDDRVNL